MCKEIKIMKKVLILHGWGGSDEPHWQWWLSEKLKQNNYEVSFPSLPNKDLPEFDIWMKPTEISPSQLFYLVDRDCRNEPSNNVWKTLYNIFLDRQFPTN